MRVLLGLVLLVGLAWMPAGCNFGPKPYYEGPKVPAFSGQVVQNGKPVTFSAEEEVLVKFTVIEGEGMGKTFGVKLKPDGTFSIGWMPIGKMMCVLERLPTDPAKAIGGPPNRYSIPDTLTIEQGKTSVYVIELGNGWNP